MSLPTGRSLSHYEILGPLGAGAMGEVYRARDTRLGREVAIKVLPAHFAEEPERLARFEREARALASLNHPGIAQIHGVDQDGALYFLALELVPGETLEERLRRGPLPVDESVDVARQIAEALDAAHDAGVIHRDLKPANVRVTPEGKVKLLDFGLAKAAPGSGAAHNSTDSVLSTEAGRLLGTPTYMAPEQARGRAIDRRVDVWALGCVLYECLSGRRAFAGESLSDVIGAVLHTEPDLAALPAETPPRLRELLADCLAKDPRERLRDAGEVRRQLDRVGHGSVDGGTTPVRAGSPTRERAAWGLALALGALAAFLALRAPAPAPEPPTVRSSLILPDDFEPARLDRPLELSPDGERLALIGGRPGEVPQVWIRALGSTRPQPLPGSEGADYVFWSPDGRDLGFFADGKLKRMPATGGPVTSVCAAASSRGASWSARGEIVFTPSPFSPLLRVPATGGTPVPITAPEGRESHRLPHFLPDGRHLLYTRTNTERNGVWLLDLDSGETRCVLEVDTDGHYAEPGQLVYVRGETLMARAFDLERLELVGEERIVVEQVRYNPYRATGVYTVSRSGSVAYDPPTILRQLQWFDVDGGAGERLGPPERYASLAISPDERHVAAFVRREGDEHDLWILDTRRGLRTKLAEDVALGGRVWFADDEHVFFSRRDLGANELFATYRQALDGSPEALLHHGAWASDLSPDGQWMLLGVQRPGTDFDIQRRRVDGSDEPADVLVTPYNEMYGKFSPDGRWLVYGSDATSRHELYLMPFDGPGTHVQVTDDGLSFSGPLAWLGDGRVVFGDRVDARRLWALPVDTSVSPPRIDDPVALASPVELELNQFAITADGERLLVAVPVDDLGRGAVNLIQNGLRSDADSR